MRPDESVDQAATRLRTYVSAKKHQLQVAFGAGFLFDVGALGSPCFTYYDNRRPGFDVVLDRAVALLGLRAHASRSIAVPRAGKRGRSARRS
jgi:hypothetical protein